MIYEDFPSILEFQNLPSDEVKGAFESSFKNCVWTDAW